MGAIFCDRISIRMDLDELQEKFGVLVLLDFISTLE